MPKKLQELLNFKDTINIMDVGAAAIAETPIYTNLIKEKLGYLNAFEGDKRQIEKLSNIYRDRVKIFTEFLYDGSERLLYLASEASGMTSLLKPNENALNFFNGFDRFGKVLKIVKDTYPAGINTITVNKDGLNASGVMYYTLDTEEFTDTKRMVVLK